MDAKTLKIASVLASLLVAVGCSGNSGGTTDTTKGATQAGALANDAAVRQAIDSADKAFVTAIKNGDVAAAASFYEENATSMPPNMEPETGRAAIEKGYTGLLQMTGKISEFSVQIKDLDVLGDHAIEVGSYDMTFTPTGAKAPVKDHGSYVNYWRKQADGSWKIHRDAIVSAVPLPNTAPPEAKK